MRRIEEARQYAKALTELWEVLIGQPVPSERQFVMWLTRYGFEIVEEAIHATAAWLSKMRQALEAIENPTPEEIAQHTKGKLDLIKYASKVMSNMLKIQQEGGRP